METIIYRKTLDVHKNGIQFTLQGFETADKLSRRIEINLTASGDTYELPLEGVVALMYITTPNSEKPSVEECIIKDNTIVYDVLPLVEEGITEMQLKLIGMNYDGARAVLVSPRFAVEVLESEAKDDSAEQTTSYTALENAVAKASAIYNARLLRIEVDENCIFKAYYADGTSYESSAIRDKMVAVSTDVNIEALIRDTVKDLAIDDIIDQFSERNLFGTAIYSDNLANAYDNATLVRWDNLTSNTPYTANLTSTSEGFAVCLGDALTQHTAVAWTKSGESFVRKTIGGVTEWTSCLTNKGGTINGDINLVSENQKPAITFEDKGGMLKGTVERDEQGGMHLDATDTQSNITSGIKVSASDSDGDALHLSRELNGEKKEYKLYGAHNLPHPAQIYSGSYKGTETDGGKNSVIVKSPFPIKLVILTGNGTMVAVAGSQTAYSMGPASGMTIGWSKVSWEEKVFTITSNVDKWNNSTITYDYVIYG